MVARENPNLCGHDARYFQAKEQESDVGDGIKELCKLIGKWGKHEPLNKRILWNLVRDLYNLLEDMRPAGGVPKKPEWWIKNAAREITTTCSQPPTFTVDWIANIIKKHAPE